METKSDDVSDATLLKQLSFPYSTAEPQLSDSELLRIDTLADLFLNLQVENDGSFASY